MTRIRYTTEEKESALQLCDEIGVHKASEQTGISVNSLYKWRSNVEDEGKAVASGADETKAEEMVAEEKDTDTTQENITARKRYTDEEKQDALQLCKKIGITKASKETGITVTSLRKWRMDAENENALASASAGETWSDEVAAQEEASPPSHEPTDTTGAGAPAENLGREEKALPPSNKHAGADEGMSEDLIRLQVENAALKAQILALKSALRVFTE